MKAKLPSDSRSPTSLDPPPARRRSKLLLLIVGLVAAFAVGLGAYLIAKEVRARSHYRDALAAIERRDFRDALFHLEQCREAWPTDRDVALLTARTARRAGELEAAQRLVDEADRLGCAQEDVFLERALLLVQQGGLGEAQGYLLHRFRSEDPNLGLIAEVLAPIYVRMHDGPLASELLDAWARREPTNHLPHLLKGELFSRLNRRYAAQVSLAEAYRLAPDDPEVRERYAQILVELKRHAEARTHLEWLIERGHGSVNVRLSLAHCCAILGDEDIARRMLTELTQEAPSDSRVLAEQGRLELEAGRPGAAERSLRQAAALEPFEPMICHNYARCLEQLGKTEEAEIQRKRLKEIEASLKRMQELMEAITAKPHDPKPRLEAGLIMIRNGQGNAGVRWLETALEQDPNHVPTHEALSDYFTKVGDLHKADIHRRLAREKK
jgi:predicted Zn-dependent protease